MSEIVQPEKKPRAPRKVGVRKKLDKKDQRTAIMLVAAILLAAINLVVAGHIATVVKTVEAEMSWKK